MYKVCEDLADLELKKAHAERNDNKKQAAAYKAQAIHYLTQALEVVKAAFPANSPHLVRIQENLESLR